MKKNICAITCILNALINVQLITLSSAQADTSLPKPPDTGTPPGSSTPGTKRPEATCKETVKPLTALNNGNRSDFTISEYPTFWFYVPYESKDISKINFLLLDENESETIYKTSMKLTQKAGIIKIVIPPNKKYALQPEKLYRWRFNLDCKPDKTPEPDEVVTGWIKRITITPQLENQLKTTQNKKYIVYKQNNIWHDAVTSLASLHFANPNNRELNNAWNKLLESLNKDTTGLASEPLVNTTIIP